MCQLLLGYEVTIQNLIFNTLFHRMDVIIATTVILRVWNSRTNYWLYPSIQYPHSFASVEWYPSLTYAINFTRLPAYTSVLDSCGRLTGSNLLQICGGLRKCVRNMVQKPHLQRPSSVTPRYCNTNLQPIGTFMTRTYNRWPITL